MSDIFREVEEDVRREKLQKIWKQYGDYIIAGVSALVIGFAGWQLWTQYQNNQRAEAAAAYQAAHVAAANNEVEAALEGFDGLIQDSPAGYAELAEFSKANTLAASGKSGEAIAAYKIFVAKYDDSFADAARVRAGWLMAETDSQADLIEFLKPVTDKAGGFGPAAREVIAYGFYRSGDLQEAQKGFEAVSNDSQSPQGLAQRADAMAVFLKAGGSAESGTVPPVEQPAAEAATP